MLYYIPYCTTYHTVLHTILYYTPCCTTYHTVLLTMLYYIPYCTSVHIALVTTQAVSHVPQLVNNHVVVCATQLILAHDEAFYFFLLSLLHTGIANRASQ
eukprot:GHVQ01016586.1.p1 GENE.GHVQ01016586.1~~GHVQ01016586.1.p1  ORF type:complete len:100 (-),score=0.71 GHVQ01016586.1:149-448(-)